MRKLSVIWVLLLLLTSAAKAQQGVPLAHEDSKPFVLGSVEELWSAQLSEKRVLNIYLPDGYNDDSNKNKSYPVVYLLDGSANEDFIHICGVVQFLTMIEATPPTIVVGIANVDRRRDFTFPTTIEKDKKDYPTTGGSEKFMLFVEKDLQPYIQKRYRVASKTIIGQSLGGLFAVQVLLEKPQLFDNYIIVSPSLWWDKESLLAKAPGLLRSFSAKKAKVYITVGNEGKIMEDDAHRLTSLLQQQTDPGLKVFFYSMPEENHLTILHNAVYKAFVTLNAKK